MKKIVFFMIIWIALITLLSFFLYGKNFDDKTFYIIDSLKNFFSLELKKLFFIFLIMFLLLMLLFLSFSFKKVENKSQHGSARWMNKVEKKENYLLLDKITSKGSGWYIGNMDNKLMFDSSDSSILLVAPPGMRKTSNIVYNNYIHAMANSELIIGSDTKDEIFYEMYPCALDYNYKYLYLNFRSPLLSMKYNIMSTVNKYTDLAMLETDESNKLMYKARAQRYAKIIANSIIGSVPGNAGSNQYFYDVAEGIITSVILIVSEYTNEYERHIINVLKIVSEGMQSEKEGDIVKTKLYKILSSLGENDKIRWFADSAVNADIRTSMNTFSTALSRLLTFVDDEIEQMICFGSDFDIEDLKKNHKYMIIINIPEENNTRHFFASLILTFYNNNLIELASEYNKSLLPFIVRLVIEEFGTMPAIGNIENTITAIRSRGVYTMLVVQSFAQIDNNYGAKKASVIKNACQNILSSALAPAQYQEAKMLSESIGNTTIVTESINKSNSNTKIYNPGNVNDQAIGRPLIYPDEIIKMKKGTWLYIPTGLYPMKTKTSRFSDLYNLSKYTKQDINDVLFNFTFRKVSYVNLSMLESSINVSRQFLLNEERIDEDTFDYQSDDIIIDDSSSLYILLKKHNKLGLYEKNDWIKIKDFVNLLYNNNEISEKDYFIYRDEILKETG